MKLNSKRILSMILVSICLNHYANAGEDEAQAAVDFVAATAEASTNQWDDTDVNAESYAEAEAACRASENCDVASDVSDEERYGGIEREYTVKGCKVTIFNDGPVRMVNEKTGRACFAPIPKDHDFGGTTRVYKEDGCTVTETTLKGGLIVGGKDCP